MGSLRTVCARAWAGEAEREVGIREKVCLRSEREGRAEREAYEGAVWA